MPFVAAVWSCPPETALEYPARYLFRFLANHGLLSVTGSPPWRTVAGGSRSYVERVAKQLSAVRARRRCAPFAGFPAAPRSGTVAAAHQFDAVVVATHPDQALRLLADPTAAERPVLGAFRYSHNATILHTDAGCSRSPAVRASWNYLACHRARRSAAQVQVSYDLNRLQRPVGHPRTTSSRWVAADAATRPRARQDGLRAPGLHPRVGRRAAPLPGLNDGGHRLRGRVPRLGLPRGRLPVRRGRGAASLGGRW